MSLPTESDWIEWRHQWNGAIDAFEQLYADWLTQKRCDSTHWRIEDDIYTCYFRLMELFPTPATSAPQAIAAVNKLVGEFMMAHHDEPLKRKRRFKLYPQTPYDYHVSDAFPANAHRWQAHLASAHAAREGNRS